MSPTQTIDNDDNSSISQSRLYRILMVHNYYQQAGGEDVVFRNEAALLQRHGHEVIEYTVTNRNVLHTPKITAAIQTVWSTAAKQKVDEVLQTARPDIVHIHNTFMAISPAIYYACRAANIPVVQTLHNYRLLCPAATLYRNGQVCEACLRAKIAINGVYHACYRHSRSQTAVTATMLSIHHLLQTWQQQVDRYIALTNFAQQKFIDGGIPAEKIAVKPNFIYPDPGVGNQTREYALFVGRLSPEKGVNLMLEAWRNLKDIPLKIVGTGPLASDLDAFVQAYHLDQIEILGSQSREEVWKLMQNAAFLVFPSQWYEGFPVTIAEAYACGLPVIATKLGAMLEIVEDQCTGLHFVPGDAQDLAEKVTWAWGHNDEMALMGKAARQQYEQHYTPENNYKQLLSIYSQVYESRAMDPAL